MVQYAMDKKTVGEAVNGGGLLIVAQWEASEGQADRVAGILDRFLSFSQATEQYAAKAGYSSPEEFIFMWTPSSPRLNAHCCDNKH